MNAADLARLEVAKRAFKATQPTDTEVQIGVRRARLSQSRPKPRTAWFSKGLVFVVLAIGSLAYAKPHALGELVEKVLPRPEAASPKGGGHGGAAVIAAPTESPAARNANGFGRAARFPSEPSSARAVPEVTPSMPEAAPSMPEAAPSMPEAAPATPEVTHAATPEATHAAAPEATHAALPEATWGAAPGATLSGPGRTAAKTSQRTSINAELARRSDLGSTAAEGASSEPPGEVSDWGRVGQALAQDDQAEALVALNQLSKSDDHRTRDKADLGRAQLLMARGERDSACKLAGSLTHRRAGSRIERLAQELLKSCAR